MENFYLVHEFMTKTGRVLTVKDLENGSLYHLEPLIIRRGGRDLRVLRDGVIERQITKECGDTCGILPIYGPFYHQREIFIGWENRNGENVWADFTARRPAGEEALRQFMRDIWPLIAAYQIYHRRGLIVGAPCWERIHRDSRGYYFPDPAFLSYVNKTAIQTLPGLTHCRPPESFRGNSMSAAGDIFFLGLFIYAVLTGETPFPLINGWPTQALIAGEQIPLWVKRPDLNREFTDLIDKMLNGSPACRPTANQLAELWTEVSDRRFLCSQDEEYSRNIREKQRYNQKRRMGAAIHAFRVWRKPMIVMFLVGLFLVALWHGASQRPVGSPLEFAKQFYQVSSDPTFMMSQQNIGVIPDILKERDERSKAARKILDQPLLALKGIRLVKAKGRTAVVEANVKWWRWNSRSWDIINCRERLELIKNGSRWDIRKRINLN